MAGISFSRPMQQYLALAGNGFRSTPLSTPHGNQGFSNDSNPIYNMFEGETPREWAENIFMGLSDETDVRPEIQDIDEGNNQNTGAFLYQSTGVGNNNATGEDEDSIAIQYTGQGNNTAKSGTIFQLTEAGNNTGTGIDITQYTTQGINTATGEGQNSTIFQDNEEGDNKATGETIGQYTTFGNNTAEGKFITQYTEEGTNTATGRGKGSIQQQAESGANVASNSSYIYQSIVTGTNTATGTAKNDVIIQQGGGTADGGAGNDQLFIMQDESGDGEHTYSITGGAGKDVINLYGSKSDWEKSQSTDGKTIYTNSETGDVVTLQDFNADEDKIKFGEEPPPPPEGSPDLSTLGQAPLPEEEDGDGSGGGTFG